jgi:UPF0755 protein
VGGRLVRRGRSGWRALIAGAALVLGVALLDGYAEHWYRAPLGRVTEPGTFEVAPGQPLGAVARGLEAKGLLDHAWLWTLIARRDGKAARIRAGEYAYAPGLTPAGLLDELVEGRVVLHPVTLVEGWTFAMALAAIQSHPALVTTVGATPDAALMAKLGAPGTAFEGQLFPDTYLVPRGASDLELLRIAHARLQERLAAAWEQRRADLPLASPYEALILASIIEKETGAPEERPRIAAVFVNRLRRGMRLQTDPTVIYGLGAAYDGNIHRRDLATDTPYNTYTRDGLPPTPIALPGGAALNAAVQPLESDELYFVATGRGDGRHVFSRTLAQHNAAVNQYLAHQRGAQSGAR